MSRARYNFKDPVFEGAAYAEARAQKRQEEAVDRPHAERLPRRTRPRRGNNYATKGNFR
jgi:hypothetical protein